MKKQERLVKLISYLLEQSEDKYTTSKMLAELVAVSTKTVLKDLSSDEAKRLLGSGEIEKKEHVGIRLVANFTQRKQITNNLYDRLGSDKFHLPSIGGESNDFERICLALLQAQKGLNKEQISNIIFRDVGAVDTVLTEIEKKLHFFNLKISWSRSTGYMIEGTEKNSRELYRTIVLRNITIDKPDQLAHKELGMYAPIIKHLETIFTEDSISLSIELVNKAEINLNERFTNYDHEILITKICIMISRMKLGNFVTSSRTFDMSVREHLVAHLIMFQLNEMFHFSYNSHEHNVLTELLLSTRRINQKVKEDEKQLDQETMTEFIYFVSSSLGVEFKDDDELKMNLFHHLQPAIRRVRYGIQIENPLLKQIQLQHTDVYVSVLTGIEIVEKAEQISFNEDEIGFICLHIVAAMNRMTHKGYIKVIFVCDEGQAVSSFLASKVERNFPEIVITERLSSDKLSHHTSTADSIFNTTPSIIQYEKIPTVSVQNILDDENMSVIRGWIINREYEKLAEKKMTLKDSFLYYHDHVQTKEEVIEKYSKLLAERGYVEKGFGNSAILREKTIPTALGRGIALPHGSSDFVKMSCIVIIKLKEVIDWSGNQVDLVIMTAINQEDIDIHRSFFEQLFKIISNEKMLNEIKSINDVGALKNILFPADKSEF